MHGKWPSCHAYSVIINDWSHGGQMVLSGGDATIECR